MSEDFNRLRLKVHTLVGTDFKQAWAFKLDIDGQPADMDIYVKDITFGPTEIANDPVKVGGKTLTFPTGAEPVSLSMTVRDHRDERVAKFFDDWATEVVNADGTVNLPGIDGSGYVRKAKRYALNEDGTEDLRNTWGIFPVQRGDVTESREDGMFLEFPMTFIQFRS